jgi:hypothetical protein
MRISGEAFAHVDTPLQAYILGFLAADGNVESNAPRISLELSVKDVDLLTLIRDELAPGHSIRVRTRKASANRFGSGESAMFAFTSVEMLTHLARFGIIPKKTLTMRWPSVLPSHLAPAFLLGYFDGDGNITQTIVKTQAYRCKNTILSEHYARWSTYFLSWDVESTVSRFLGRDVRNDVEYDQPA